MQGKWKRRLIVCLKLLTKLLIILVSCGMTFIGILIMLIPLLPIIAITGGRGHMHSHGEVECMFRFSKTLIYTFVGWLEGVLIYLVGYAKHVGKAIKARDGQMMNPVEFWKVYTSGEEFINREKWVTEKKPDSAALAFVQNMPTLLLVIPFLVLRVIWFVTCLFIGIIWEIGRVLWYFMKCPLSYGRHIIRVVSGQEKEFKGPRCFLNEYRTAEKAKREKHRAEKEAEKAEKKKKEEEERQLQAESAQQVESKQQADNPPELPTSVPTAVPRTRRKKKKRRSKKWRKKK